jgi:hypothetical protein
MPPQKADYTGRFGAGSTFRHLANCVVFSIWRIPIPSVKVGRVKKKDKLSLLFILLIPCWVIAARFDIDLVVLHYTTGLVRAHHYANVYAQNGSLGRYFYGPFSLILFNPLAWIPYSVLKWLWIVLQTLSFVLFWRYLTRLYPFLDTPAARWSWILVFIVAINPIHNNFQSNNIQLMLAATMLGAELLTRVNAPIPQFLAGILVMAAAGVKVFPIFIATFYLLGKPRAVRYGVYVGTALVVALPFLYFGKADALTLYEGFFRNLTSYNTENSLAKVPDILCLPSLLTRWFSVETLYPDLGPKVIKGVIVALSFVFFYFAWKKQKALPKEQAQRESVHLWALAMALMVLFNPSTRPHYFIFYVPAFCSLLEMAKVQVMTRWFLMGSLASATLLIAFTAEGVVGKTINDQLEAWSVPTVGMIILCVALAKYLFGSGSKTYRFASQS